ncbi:MAG: bifunctional riboflavin kinase/FAD synthetase [Candidatus Stahlbacteria bacterium]|nr:bifunctional riboflavin kinase/FAD synthetase [Candidatus Stahlbacteria bacterium]
MRIIKDIAELKELKFTSISIGNFDGVHLGHQSIIEKITRSPNSLIVTFDPHPIEVLSNEEKLSVITSCDEKITLFDELGIENTFILTFNKSIALMGAEEFIGWLIVDYIDPKELVIGYNHHFGNGANGDFELLVHIGTQFGFEVIRVPPVYVDGFPVSSTRIRRAIANGEMEVVNKLLGRPYSITSCVVTGKGRGTSLSYPTANLRVQEKKLIPKNGVYAVYVEYNKNKFGGMMNVGDKPTFSEPYGLEVHIFDFNNNLLGETIKVEFVKYLRQVCDFENAAALKLQLQKDESFARQILLRKSG